MLEVKSSLVGRPCVVLIPGGLGESVFCCCPEIPREMPEGCKDALVLIGFMFAAGPDGAGDVLGLGRSDILVSEMEGVARECLLCSKEEYDE